MVATYASKFPTKPSSDERVRNAELLAQAPKAKLLEKQINRALEQSGQAEKFNQINQELIRDMNALMHGKAVDKKAMSRKISQGMEILNSIPSAKANTLRYLKDISKSMGLSSKDLAKRLESPISENQIAQALDNLVIAA